jgi:uncharacterized protein (TIGR03382 family)
MLMLALLLATPHMNYHGGRVLEAPRFYNIYWGSYWASHEDEVAWFDGFTREVAPSRELASQVVEYATPSQTPTAGTYAATLVVNEDPAALITDADFSNFIANQIQAAAVPQPDEHNVYTVFLAPGVKIQNEDKAVGYHTVTNGGVREIMVHFDNYVLDIASRDVAAVTYSHEMAETITDPDMDGWYDDALGYAGEVGDVCEGHLALVGTYTIQQEWSNAEGQCMAFRDVPLPPSGGVCPPGTVLTGADCQGNGISWGCSSTGAGFPSALALALVGLLRRKRRA